MKTPRLNVQNMTQRIYNHILPLFASTIPLSEFSTLFLREQFVKVCVAVLLFARRRRLLFNLEVMNGFEV